MSDRYFGCNASLSQYYWLVFFVFERLVYYDYIFVMWRDDVKNIVVCADQAIN